MNDVTTDVGGLPYGVTAVSVQGLVNSTPFDSQDASNFSTISAITAMVGLNIVAASPEVTTSPEDGLPEKPLHYPGAEGLESFGFFYKGYHGYIASVVCAFGIIANILNIIVLTRKNMISATNCILTGLAVSDGLLMVAYLPFALRFYCLYDPTTPTPERNSLSAIRFMLFYACFSVVVHTVSIWLTVTLAVFRYIFIRYPRRGAVLCTLNRAKLSVFLVYLVTLVACVPNFVSITIKGDSESDNGDNSTTVIWYVTFKLDTAANRYVYNMNFWIQAIIAKLVPCIGLTILSVLLIKTMKEAERRRQMLRNKNASQKKGENHGRERRNDGRTHRTTVMLLTVVFLFLLTEFPQGILNLLSGILPYFVEEVYGPLGDLMDILALINNGINFILYCTMSKQFRDTFIQVFFQIGIRDRRTFALVPQTVTKTEYDIATTQA